MGGSGYGPPVAALLACAAVLSACGGDGGPSRPGTRIGEPGPEPGPPGVSPVGPTAPASVWAAAALGGADVLFATSLHEESGFGERAVHDTRCSGLSCSGSGGGAIRIGNAGRLASAGAVERTGGIDMVSASDLDSGSWGGWMRNSGFGVLLERTGMGAELREFRYGLALGGLTEVAEGEDISATWRGRMVGVAGTGGFSDGLLQGVAVLTYRSTAALGDDAEDGDVVGRIDAAFTEIVGVSTGVALPDARFANVPVSLLDVTATVVERVGPVPPGATPEVDVTARMAFDAGVAGNRIRGGFFGPGRAEVAGVFEQNGILGAFGAER